MDYTRWRLGAAAIIFNNTSQSPRTFTLGRLNTDVMVEQFLTALQGDPLEALALAALVGGETHRLEKKPILAPRLKMVCM